MQPHPIIPNNISEINLLKAIDALLKIGSKTKLKSEAQIQTQILANKKIQYFFTSDLIRFLENTFTSDGVHASQSPNALFGKRLKRLSIEKKNILPIQQIYNKPGTSEESFPIYDDNNSDTSSALWVITCNDINKEIEKM